MTILPFRLAFIGLILAISVQGMPSWYNCPATCVPPACTCCSNSAPGGLTPEQTPQFILLTHDDATNAFSNKVMRAITDSHKNPNGCNVPATWYTLQDGTDCKIAKTLLDQNHEIALHTVHHAALVPNFNGDLKEEMLGVRDYMNKTCGIPLEEMVGYRHPYLVSNPATRKIIYDAGLKYDSTMIENFPSESSPAPGQRVWPFTMDNGICVNCQWNYPDGQCQQQTEKYAGLWEVPMWELQDEAGAHIASMDPEGDVYGVLKNNFDMNYNGNKAPFGIYVHAPWFNEGNTAAVNKFLNYSLSQPNVWAVTTKRLIEWMENPVPNDKMNEWYQCNEVDLSAAPGEIPCQQYQVQQGDTSYTISVKFAVLAADLLKLNPNLGDGSKLTVGQEIRIPPWTTNCTAANIINANPEGAAGPSYAYGDRARAPIAALLPLTASELSGAGAPVTAITGNEAVGIVDYTNPQSGMNVTFHLQGRSTTAFQTDLKRPFSNSLALGLGLKPEAVTFISANSTAPPADIVNTGAAGTPPTVIATVRIASGDPVATYKNASQVLAKGSAFENDVLKGYQLQQIEEPTFTVFKDGKVIDPTIAASPSALPKPPGRTSAADSFTVNSLKVVLMPVFIVLSAFW